VNSLQITYSLADQQFQRTKSIGILNLSVQLAARLAKRPEFDRFTLLTNQTLEGQLPIPATTRVQRCDLAIGGRFRRLVWDQWSVYRAARQSGNPWLFLPKGFASFVRLCPVNLALYAHDAIHEYYQRHNPRGLPFLERLYFQKCVRAGLRYANVIFTNSDFTRRELERLARACRLPAPPLRTAGIGFSAPTAPVRTKQDRIVVLAGRWPHKRTDLAVEYLARWQRTSQFPGNMDWVGGLSGDLVLPDFSGWRRHSRLPESEYRQLMAQARALIYFSDYEGFGMPPVEAVLAGVCPVYSAIPATEEVMDGAGCSFSNQSYDTFSKALTQALAVAPSQIEAWAMELLRRHNWDAVAERVVSGLQEFDAGPNPILRA